MSFLLNAIPPTGKSGPCTNCRRSSVVASGLSIRCPTASESSRRLCGGIFVAIPTAIPSVPMRSRFGTPAGNTSGSFFVPSKFGRQSTVSFSRSRSISSAILDIFASVYRYAAAPSPSIEPKFPCPMTSGYRVEKLCASFTIAS